MHMNGIDPILSMNSCCSYKYLTNFLILGETTGHKLKFPEMQIVADTAGCQ
jgi:hypothetical protein